jgi:hypothetical protein
MKKESWLFRDLVAARQVSKTARQTAANVANGKKLAKKYAIVYGKTIAEEP